ncbi:hypothetical protein [Ekhidna sp.]|uniref:hypothetical protein n=1 Tax=Ekhidna sp. TaxID=2608089 RepID=UPI0032ED1010
MKKRKYTDLDVTLIRQQVESVLKDHFLTVLKEELKSESAQVKEILGLADAFQALPIGERMQPDVISRVKEEVYDVLSKSWDSPEKEDSEEPYEELKEALVASLDQLPEVIHQTQPGERFTPLDEDSFFWRNVKKVKLLAFKLSTIGRKRTKKKGTTPVYWGHSIPLKNLALYYFGGSLLRDLIPVTDQFYIGLCKQYLLIKQFEEEVLEGDVQKTTTQIKSSITRSSKSILAEVEKGIHAVLDSKTSEFQHAAERVGTIELSARKYSDISIKTYNSISSKKWDRNNQEWKNTVFALFEEWRLDLDIHILKNKAHALLAEFQSSQLKKLDEQISPEIALIQDFISEAEKSISTKEDGSLSKTLKNINYQAGKKLGQDLVPELCDKLTSQNIVNLINKLEVEVRQHVEELDNEHVIVPSNSYDSALKADELKRISPYELISFETLNRLQEDLEIVKKELFQSLEDTVSSISDLDNIITFNMGAAIATLEEEGKTEEEVEALAVEGLKRALTRLTTSKDQLTSSLEKTADQVEAIINTFCESILELTDNENVIQLRLRIAKAKAAQQAAELKEGIKDKIITQKNKLVIHWKDAQERIKKLLSKISNSFILTASKPEITKEVSDFLLSSQSAINSLPLIYRRLYRIEPLEDLELFEGRENELKKLDEAFENWNKGRYAGTVVLGEKWGGLTSFVNFAISRSKYPFSITRFSATDNITTKSSLIDFMKIILKNDSFQNLEEIIQFLNEGQKRIIVLEDLQSLYLRKIDGFVALRLLFELMARTYERVFWITTCTIYAWKYLSKAINIDEYFSYAIEMGELSNDEIVNIVWKRNRISGFNIQFEPSEKLAVEKKFLKLSARDQQSLLKKEYFEALNAFAKSNVSLALIFWLLSTKEVDESTITISHFKNPDLNFINVLSMDKVYTLHALILHDGLTEKQLAEVLNISESMSQLNLLALLEDGIVMKEETVFLVNPIVYRNTVLMLRSKNLIH